MQRLSLPGLAVAIVAALGVLTSGASAQTVDPEAPCGRDNFGRPFPQPCSGQGPGGSQLEAACLTTARVDYCLQYHALYCQQFSLAGACRAYQIGSACQSGDQNGCNFYMSLLTANRACALEGNQQACVFLKQQGF